MIKNFTINTTGRDFAVGDIHGCFTDLQAALAVVGFNREVDRLFSVGDLVDRGPECEQVCDWLAKPWFHAVRGNHDDFAIRYVRNGEIDPQHYIRNGGGWFLALPTDQQQEIAVQLQELPFGISVETKNGLVGIVHADIPTDTWAELVEIFEKSESRLQLKSAADCLMWSRTRVALQDETGVSDLLALVVGHTPGREVCVLGNVLYIDTMGWRADGHFTLIDLSTITAN